MTRLLASNMKPVLPVSICTVPSSYSRKARAFRGVVAERSPDAGMHRNACHRSGNWPSHSTIRSIVTFGRITEEGDQVRPENGLYRSRVGAHHRRGIGPGLRF